MSIIDSSHCSAVLYSRVEVLVGSLECTVNSIHNQVKQDRKHASCSAAPGGALQPGRLLLQGSQMMQPECVL